MEYALVNSNGTKPCNTTNRLFKNDITNCQEELIDIHGRLGRGLHKE